MIEQRMDTSVTVERVTVSEDDNKEWNPGFTTHISGLMCMVGPSVLKEVFRGDKLVTIAERSVISPEKDIIETDRIDISGVKWNIKLLSPSPLGRGLMMMTVQRVL